MKIVALIVVFMILVFSLVTTIIPGSDSYKQQNPVVRIWNELTEPFRKADTLSPSINNALERVEAKLPSLPNLEEKKSDDAHNLLDHSEAVFSHLDLPRTNFAGSTVNAAQFESTFLDGAILEGVTGDNVNFSSAKMAKANLSASVLTNSNFTGAELREATARAAKLEGSDFTGGDISFASFSGADMKGVQLDEVYAAGAIFTGASMQKADFAGADLTGVRFERAFLANSSFAGADLKLANFTGANIYGADFSGALNLTAEQIAGACADGETKLPEGMPATRC